MSRDGFGPVATFTSRMPAAPALELALHVPTFEEIYASHVRFVWRVARALGVPEASIEDAVQDVFVVVHRRLGDYEPRGAITTWLFAITRRVALAHRRRGTRTEPLADDPVGGADTFAAVSRAQAASTVTSILDTMDDDKRVVFALVELEQLSVPEVARMLDLNLNTAYSRLRLARAAFETELKKRGLR